MVVSEGLAGYVLGKSQSEWTVKPPAGTAGGSKISLGTDTTSSFRVMIGLNNACLVSATDLDFGEASSLADGVLGTTQISVQCTNRVDYTVALSGGINGTISKRKLANSGITGMISYNLYTDANRTAIWGDNTYGSTVAGEGTGLVQSLTVYGKVDAQTETPAMGTYTDTITVTVDY